MYNQLCIATLDDIIKQLYADIIWNVVYLLITKNTESGER
jgi:hypothetical protein